jgi:hypothetical protein
MASIALTNFNGFVDSLPLTDNQKNRLKEKGEEFYIAVVKEYTAHVRKHLEAARTPEKTREADYWAVVLDRLSAEDGSLTMETARAVE